MPGWPSELYPTCPRNSRSERGGRPVGYLLLRCVLYEMLTGKRAFQGTTRFSIAAAVLTKEPQALRDLAPGVPRSLERIVEKCLRKKLLDRWQTWT